MNGFSMDAGLQAAIGGGLPTIDMYLAESKRTGRNDGSNGVFTEQFTTKVLAEVFRKKYEQHKWVGGGLMPMDTSAGAGALAVAWDDVGYSSDDDDGFVSDVNTDTSNVHVNLERNSNPVHTLARTYCYDMLQMNAAAGGNYDPIVDMATRTREDWELKLNDAIRFGVPRLNVPGFFRNPSLQPTTAVVGDWASASAANIKSDFAAAVTSFRTGTAGVSAPNTVVFDLETWTLLEGLQNSDASDVNVLQWLRKNYPFITTWTWDFGLRGQGDGGTGEGRDYTGGSNCLMLYRNDRTVLRAILPMAMTPVGPQQMGITFKTWMWGRYGGLAIPRPKEIQRLEGL